ncbi:MAG: amino acid ABC transporter permease [Armatimonadetes bacterium]|nr:amino acid ABC transporter permease [Armatimonadota bacterium]MBI2247520.1 amino acid ABC transporter permease [Armatimonadota bacterium]MBI2973448.1 amino acid ABC transporter permease [Armatimonadota bacterium]
MSEAERGIIPSTAVSPPARGRLLPLGLEAVPWWALVLLLAGLLITFGISTSQVYKDTLAFLWSGVALTLRLSVSAYALALVFGLVAGLMRISKQPVLYTVSTLYVEVIRGVPLLVLLIYIAFVAAPLVSEASAALLTRAGLPSAATFVRGMVRSDMNRAILGLAVGYGAYLAEIYRAGIESIPKGQMEAARSLGMTYWQSMRHIVLPQAIRVVLPPLGNDFIAMLKDSALASAIAVPELTQTGRLLTARTFRALQTYNMVALLYLTMTLVGSLGVRALERWAAKGKH